MTTPELFGLLESKYPAPQYAFLGNVRNTTGYVKDIRTADALALGLWPSRGMHLTGFELKVSRSDWLHEYRQPEKAEEICQFCDFWYLVVSDKEMVKEGELPVTWGLMAVEKGRLQIVKEAPLLTAKAMDRPFLAGFMRNVSESYIHKNSISARLAEARKRGEAGAKSEEKSAVWKLSQEQERIKKFEQASGVEIESWRAGDIGEAVKMVMKSKHLNVRTDLLRIRDKIDEALNGKDNI